VTTDPNPRARGRGVRAHDRDVLALGPVRAAQGANARSGGRVL